MNKEDLVDIIFEMVSLNVRGRETFLKKNEKYKNLYSIIEKYIYFVKNKEELNFFFSEIERIIFSSYKYFGFTNIEKIEDKEIILFVRKFKKNIYENKNKFLENKKNAIRKN